MPNKDSAKKYMRVSAKKQLKNNEWFSKLSNLERKFKKAVATGKKEDAATLSKELQKTLDRAARRNVIHKNAAARTKSRIVAKLK